MQTLKISSYFRFSPVFTRPYALHFSFLYAISLCIVFDSTLDSLVSPLPPPLKSALAICNFRTLVQWSYNLETSYFYWFIQSWTFHPHLYSTPPSLYSTSLYSASLFSTSLYSTPLYFTPLHSTSLFCTLYTLDLCNLYFCLLLLPCFLLVQGQQ